MQQTGKVRHTRAALLTWVGILAQRVGQVAVLHIVVEDSQAVVGGQQVLHVHLAAHLDSGTPEEGHFIYAKIRYTIIHHTNTKIPSTLGLSCACIAQLSLHEVLQVFTLYPGLWHYEFTPKTT